MSRLPLQLIYCSRKTITPLQLDAELEAKIENAFRHNKAESLEREPTYDETISPASIAPLGDGMNLVAKAYVAAQDPADPGVLILSRFVGAAAQMKEALTLRSLRGH